MMLSMTTLMSGVLGISMVLGGIVMGIGCWFILLLGSCLFCLSCCVVVCLSKIISLPQESTPTRGKPELEAVRGAKWKLVKLQTFTAVTHLDIPLQSVKWSNSFASYPIFFWPQLGQFRRCCVITVSLPVAVGVWRIGLRFSLGSCGECDCFLLFCWSGAEES